MADGKNHDFALYKESGLRVAEANRDTGRQRLSRHRRATSQRRGAAQGHQIEALDKGA